MTEVTPHANDMTAWPTIACQRGCHQHVSRHVDVDLAGEHGYRDLPQIPERLATQFSLWVWDPEVHPVGPGDYCPARDAVSETIVSHRIWEPRETALTLDVLHDGDLFLDLGCQIGWYSVLAATIGAQVVAVDAELANLQLAARSLAEVHDAARHKTQMVRIAAQSEPFPVRRYRLVKIDIEGAEADAVRMLGPAIDAGTVDHLMLEVSPVFTSGDAYHYPRLLASLAASGFELYELPPKQHHPRPFTTAREYLESMRLDARPGWQDEVAAWHQADVWCRRHGAAW